MEPTIETRLQALEQKAEQIYVSVEKTRKYFLWTFIATIAVFVLPLIGIAFVLPSFLHNYVGTIDQLSQ